MFNRLSKVTTIKALLVTTIVLPSICSGDGAYNGPSGRQQLINQLASDPVLLQRAKTFVLTNFPEIVQSISQLPGFFSETEGGANEGNTPKKAPRMIGKARGTISRNLRPLNPAINTNSSSETNTDDSTVSVTPGREFTPQALWNAWADGYYFDVRDRRYNLSLDGRESLLTLGTDKLVKENLAIGLLLSLQYAHSTNFGGNWLVNSDEITIGPYFGYQISPNWALNTSLGYGNATNKLNIGAINGRYIAQSCSLEIDVAGQYNYNVANMRYKSSLYYSYIHNNAYQMSGTASGTSINIPVAKDNFSIGLVSMMLEINHDFKLSLFNVFEPFAEIGVTYQFLRPNNGQILTGNLLLVKTSPWSGLMRLGARQQVSKSLYFEANVAYLSIGQHDLNIWQGRLYLSYLF